MNHDSLLIAVMHGAVAADAPADEQDVLVEVECVCAALQRLGYRSCRIAVDLNLQQARQQLQSLQPDLVFNLVESLDGRGQFIGWVPALLESLNLPYTGVGHDGMVLTSNKLLSKAWLQAQQLPTPAWADKPEEAQPQTQTPWIVKSVWEHASIGLTDASIVTQRAALEQQWRACQQNYGGQWFAEAFIAGREFNIALLQDGDMLRVLPLAELLFVDFPADKPHMVSYEAKWDPDSFAYQHTPRRFLDVHAEPLLAKQLTDTALACWHAFQLAGYARVDMRVDAQGRVWVLEVNANPCLAPDAGFSAALQAANISFDQAITGIVQAAQTPQRQQQTSTATLSRQKARAS